MNRNEIIELVVVRAALEEQQSLRRTLLTYTTEELNKIQHAIVAQAASSRAEEELIRIGAERAAERVLFELSREPQRKAEAEQQEKQDRETFKQAARQFRFSTVEANFRILVSALSPGGLTPYGIQNAIESNAVHLAPALGHELAQWAEQERKETQKAQEERQDYLLNEASPLELREIAKTEAEQRRVQFQREQTERQIAARAKIDATQGYASLPEFTSDGVKIDANFLKNLKTDIYRNYLRRYGATAITTRLNGIQ